MMTDRPCSRCGGVRDGSNAGYCKKCFNEYQRARYARIPRDKREVRNLNLRRYGITVNDLERMMEEQGHSCLVCARPLDIDGGRVNGPHVDHEHDSDSIRGLLCLQCNTGLGLFGDDPDRLLAAAAYIMRHRLSMNKEN